MEQLRQAGVVSSVSSQRELTPAVLGDDKMAAPVPAPSKRQSESEKTRAPEQRGRGQGRGQPHL